MVVGDAQLDRSRGDGLDQGKPLPKLYTVRFVKINCRLDTNRWFTQSAYKDVFRVAMALQEDQQP